MAGLINYALNKKSEIMEDEKICQSCSMPLNSDDVLGTEKNGTKNHEYCKYCYKDGAFTNPNLTLDEMLGRAKTEMNKKKVDNNMIQQAIERLPHLKRWIKPKTPGVL